MLTVYLFSSFMFFKKWPCFVPLVGTSRLLNEIIYTVFVVGKNPYFLTSMPGLHSKRELKRIRRAERKSKLSKWFNLPKPDITEEERDDLELIRLRRAISSDTHVRRSDGKSAYFQRGVVVDDPGSFYDRLPRKQRGKTLVDELLANAEIMKVQRKRYAKIARTIAEKRAAVRRREQQRIKRLQSGRKKQQATVVVPD
ncbi:Deoxynucleotidyltransferase terminal-interacting protein isoform 4 [Schistosoma japonicum]|uniref:Deoxynucleotidyltransferase terminal-interacting protein isoform 4 n=1 Tax=Schistosoma japonicum TaxID=6182 RepID=A0A4Z2D9S6_SCHJA|nr:Deoxynucleotidyltransferase terminal-interacting protein isoform 4 [Schistosoma japonicum]